MDGQKSSKSSTEDDDKAESVKQAHKQVFDAITQLIDVVEEAVLLEKLHFLDVGSWDEIVEERYLANVCGFPACSSTIQRQDFTGRRYKIDRREKKIYTAIPLFEKFCSTECYERSCHIQRQLYEEALWFNSERGRREYSIAPGPRAQGQQLRRPEDILVEEADRFLLTRLDELKIADNAESSSSADEEGETDDEDDAKAKQKEEDAQFLNEVRSYITSVAQMTTKSKANMMGMTPGPQPNKPPPNAVPVNRQKKTDIVRNEVVETAGDMRGKQTKIEVAAGIGQESKTPTKSQITEKQMEEKLAKLRQKYGDPRKQIKRPTPIIEALPMDPKEASKLS